MTLPTPAVTLQAARRRSGLAPGVPSPCISVCQIDATSGLCRGCYRTLDEIRLWSQSGDANKLLVWQQVELRQQREQETP
ncbi:MAG: DUF1289 domain-containing protein [Hydrogenophaga sp.]|jgi:uncharacterized protein|uniref:DUF1289 domain-containing protein n=1 Tax=Hydrogenophaga sp. TaxID=1904254 RepID=UPI00263187D9|nr:DUF1289 domain-containing protein [Hydrogenophaga sp.]MCV0441173.1 DUF1289 domain-containing protein [Hydrogenophaga sp.]